jgi:MOSC domain-containing protein YiiM
MGDPSFVKQFGQASRRGAYLRIVKEGQLAAGDAVEVDLAMPDHGVTLRLVSDAILLDPSLIAHALEAPQLAPSLRAWITARLP